MNGGARQCLSQPNPIELAGLRRCPVSPSDHLGGYSYQFAIATIDLTVLDFAAAS
jgi:hypothetical protein